MKDKIREIYCCGECGEDTPECKNSTIDEITQLIAEELGKMAVEMNCGDLRVKAVELSKLQEALKC